MKKYVALMCLVVSPVMAEDYVKIQSGIQSNRYELGTAEPIKGQGSNISILSRKDDFIYSVDFSTFDGKGPSIHKAGNNYSLDLTTETSITNFELDLGKEYKFDERFSLIAGVTLDHYNLSVSGEANINACIEDQKLELPISQYYPAYKDITYEIPGFCVAETIDIGKSSTGFLPDVYFGGQFNYGSFEGVISMSANGSYKTRLEYDVYDEIGIYYMHEEDNFDFFDKDAFSSRTVIGVKYEW